jgi:hypothetical protein
MLNFKTKTAKFVIAGLVGLGFVVILLGVFFLVPYYQDKSIKIYKHYVTNISPTSATVVWFTDKPVRASVVVGKDRFFDTRDVEELEIGEYSLKKEGSQKRYTHSVTVRGLEPEGEYDFMITNGRARFSNKEYSFATVSLDDTLLTPDPVYGVIDSGEEAKLEDGVVLLRKVGGDGQKSNYVSSTVSGGAYSLDVSSLYYEGEGKRFDILDREVIQEIYTYGYTGAELRNVSIIIKADEDQPVDDILLSKGEKVAQLQEGVISSVYAQACVEEGDPCTADTECCEGNVCSSRNFCVASSSTPATQKPTKSPTIATTPDTTQTPTPTKSPTITTTSDITQTPTPTKSPAKSDSVDLYEGVDSEAENLEVSLMCVAYRNLDEKRECERVTLQQRSVTRKSEVKSERSLATPLENVETRLDALRARNFENVESIEWGNGAFFEVTCSIGVVRRFPTIESLEADLNEHTCYYTRDLIDSFHDRGILAKNNYTGVVAIVEYDDLLVEVFCADGRSIPFSSAISLGEKLDDETCGEKCISNPDSGEGGDPSCGFPGDQNDQAMQGGGGKGLASLVRNDYELGLQYGFSWCYDRTDDLWKAWTDSDAYKIGLVECGVDRLISRVSSEGNKHYCAFACSPWGEPPEQWSQSGVCPLGQCLEDGQCKDMAVSREYKRKTCNYGTHISQGDNGECVAYCDHSPGLLDYIGVVLNSNECIDIGGVRSSNIESSRMALESGPKECGTVDSVAVGIKNKEDGRCSFVCKKPGDGGAFCDGDTCSEDSVSLEGLSCEGNVCRGVSTVNIPISLPEESSGNNQGGLFGTYEECWKECNRNKIGSAINFKCEPTDIALEDTSLVQCCWGQHCSKDYWYGSGALGACNSMCGPVPQFMFLTCLETATNLLQLCSTTYCEENPLWMFGSDTVHTAGSGCLNHRNSMIDVVDPICVERANFRNSDFQVKCTYDELQRSSSLINGSLRLKTQAQEGSSVAGSLDQGFYTISGESFDSVNIEVGELSEIVFFFDENGNGIKDPEENYLPSDIGESLNLKIQKVSDLLNYPLNVGWNLVSIPMLMKGEDTSNISKASELLDYLNEKGSLVTHISAYRAGSFLTYSKRSEGEVEIAYSSDFNILPGEAYFIKNYRNSNISLTGQYIDGSLEVRVNPGWNLIGIYNSQKESLGGFEVLEDFNSQGIGGEVISSWNQGIYENIIIKDGAKYGKDIMIFPTRGYWVKSNSAESKTFKP